MALINCSECGRKISSHAIACPQCGNPTPSHESSIVSFLDDMVESYHEDTTITTKPKSKRRSFRLALWTSLSILYILFAIAIFTANSDNPATTTGIRVVMLAAFLLIPILIIWIVKYKDRTKLEIICKRFLWVAIPLCIAGLICIAIIENSERRAGTGTLFLAFLWMISPLIGPFVLGACVVVIIMKLIKYSKSQPQTIIIYKDKDDPPVTKK